MKKITFCLAGAALLALVTPSLAQVGVRIGEDGVGVRVGEREHHGERDRDRGRDDWRGRRHRRDCETIWRDGRRITICHRG